MTAEQGTRYDQLTRDSQRFKQQVEEQQGQLDLLTSQADSLEKELASNPLKKETGKGRRGALRSS